MNLPSEYVCMSKSDEDRERPNIETQVAFKGDFNEEEIVDGEK